MKSWKKLKLIMKFKYQNKIIKSLINYNIINNQYLKFINLK